MAKQKSVGNELESFKDYLRSEDNEDAKRPLIYPLFKKLFSDKFKVESNAHGADVYVEGQLIVESKTSSNQWLDGFYQALHYHRKFGLTYNTIIVVAHKFVAIWKLNKLPESAIVLERTADATKAPNVVGKENAKKTDKAEKVKIKDAAFYWLEPKDLEGDIFAGAKNLTTESFEILKILNNLDSDRIQINTHNFINTIDKMKVFFVHPIDAVHAFYTIVAYWDITSTVAEKESGELCVVGFKGNRMSDSVKIPHKHVKEFKKFIESQYIFTNEGSGLTVDYYFSRFDEVLAKIDPEYVKQHGIFFTDSNLSKFALWYAKYHFPGNINQDYIVFDPAGGSGNLVSSWRGKLKHKIISELQPDLLRTIERRMKADPFHIETGFTIVPKTIENKGLNFLDRSAEDYLDELKKAVKASTNLEIDKPIAFLLNPPYKNTDEKQEKREEKEAHYEVHPSIINLTGEDAGKERYLAFLGQILNIAHEQEKENHKLKPVVMIFTPTSWLIPRPTYVPFRTEWDRYFKYHSGFIVTSNEWFKLEGKWPLAFTIWVYDHNEKGNKNEIKALDLCELNRTDLNINWNENDEQIDKSLKKVLSGFRTVNLSSKKGEIKSLLPEILKNGEPVRQTRYDYSIAKKENDYNKVVSGFPLKDKANHFELNRKCGDANGIYVGFMDDNTPVRVKQDSLNRMSALPDRVWFRLDSDLKGINKTKVFSGAADNRSYCAYDLESAKATFSWFAITKALNGVYPVWANQYDLWPPKVKKELESYWYSLCFAFVLSENRCVVTKFEQNNPVANTPEVFVDNPLCPTNKNSFWSKHLDEKIVKKPKAAFELVEKVKELYTTWNRIYCKGQKKEHVGLQNEPYFKYFDYADFLTPHSGLIQIEKHAQQEGLADMNGLFEEVKELTKIVKGEIYRLLTEEFKYFN